MPKDSVQHLSLSQLQPNPFQPRGHFSNEELEELVQSIKTYGILEPLVIAETPAGYQIIAGERRWRAAKLAGLEEIPVLIKKTTPRGMLEMALVENVQRIDLNPIERGQAFQQLMREFNFTATQISEKIGKSKGYISNTLGLLNLPDAIKDGLLGGNIAEGHARAIMGITDEKAMIECYKLILRENASVRRAEDLARRFREKLSPYVNKVGRPLQVSDTEVARWRRSFQQLFKSKTQLRLIRSQRQTRLAITLKGSPEDTQKDLEKILGVVEAASDK